MQQVAELAGAVGEARAGARVGGVASTSGLRGLLRTFDAVIACPLDEDGESTISEFKGSIEAPRRYELLRPAH